MKTNITPLELFKLPFVNKQIIENLFHLIRSGENSNGVHNKFLCCDNKYDFKYYKSLAQDSWTGFRYCEKCNCITIIDYADRMSGNCTESYFIYK